MRYSKKILEGLPTWPREDVEDEDGEGECQMPPGGPRQNAGWLVPISNAESEAVSSTKRLHAFGFAERPAPGCSDVIEHGTNYSNDSDRLQDAVMVDKVKERLEERGMLVLAGKYWDKDAGLTR